MNAIKGIWHGGQVLLQEPADWPDGTTLIVEPAAPHTTLGLREEDWPMKPDEIATHLARMDQIQPLDMTPEEEGAWEAARKAQRDYDVLNFEQRSQRIEGIFQ